MRRGTWERPSAEVRFWANVKKIRGHWMWQGRPNAWGYGRLVVDGVLTYAHRFSYTLLVGPIPEGLGIDHLCRVKLCVRPDHLEPVTTQVNTLRGEAPSAINAAKTHCPKGHELVGANLYEWRGHRRCRPCNTETARRYRHRHQGRIP
jgi:hypothetical protein